MSSFGLEYQKIHACPNDCVLYQNENENLEKYPRCELSRYKRKGTRDGFEDSLPFIHPKSVDEYDVDVGYTRVDHTEGIYLN